MRSDDIVCAYHFLDERECDTNDWVSTVQIQSIHATVELHNTHTNLMVRIKTQHGHKYRACTDLFYFSSYFCPLSLHFPLTSSLLE